MIEVNTAITYAAFAYIAHVGLSFFKFIRWEVKDYLADRRWAKEVKEIEAKMITEAAATETVKNG